MSAAVVAAARGWLGTPYVHRASLCGSGVDCLGLVRGVWREVVGPEPWGLPAYDPRWDIAGPERLWQAMGRYFVPRAEPVPGCVLLFRVQRRGAAKHLGLLSRAGDCPAFIHAYSGRAVVESGLTAGWRRRLVAAFDYPARGTDGGDD